MSKKISELDLVVPLANDELAIARNEETYKVTIEEVLSTHEGKYPHQTVDDFIDSRGQNNGIACLDDSGKVLSEQLPSIAINDTFDASNELAQLALEIQKGDICIRLDENKCYIAINSENIDMSDWKLLKTPTDTILSVDGRTGGVDLSDRYEPKNSNIQTHISDDDKHRVINDNVDDGATSSLWSADKINKELAVKSDTHSHPYTSLGHNHDTDYVRNSNFDDTDVLGKIKNVDGAGSGLDADLLDGAHKDTDITLSGNSDSSIPTEKAIKGYVDNNINKTLFHWKGILAIPINATLASAAEWAVDPIQEENINSLVVCVKHLDLEAESNIAFNNTNIGLFNGDTDKTEWKVFVVDPVIIASGGENNNIKIWSTSTDAGAILEIFVYAIPVHSHKVSDLPSSSTSVKGVVQLSNSVTSTSISLASTANAVKNAYNRGVSAETNIQGGISSSYNTLQKLYTWIAGQLSTKEPKLTKKTGFNLSKSDSYISTSTTTLATSSAVRKLYDYLKSYISGMYCNKYETGFEKVGQFDEYRIGTAGPTEITATKYKNGMVYLRFESEFEVDASEPYKNSDPVISFPNGFRPLQDITFFAAGSGTSIKSPYKSFTLTTSGEILDGKAPTHGSVYYLAKPAFSEYAYFEN